MFNNWHAFFLKIEKWIPIFFHFFYSFSTETGFELNKVICISIFHSNTLDMPSVMEALTILAYFTKEVGPYLGKQRSTVV